MSLRSNVDAVKNLFADSSGLFHLIHQYNIHPAAYTHPSWLEAIIPGDIVGRLQKSRRGIARLSKIILQQHNLHDETCYDFEYSWWRFALLPADILIKLAYYCGLTALHRQIAAVVDKTQLLHIKKHLDKPDYVYAVKRAPLLIGQQCEFDLFWNGHFDISRLARQFGTQYFLSHFMDAPRAIKARLAFKFSKSHESVAVDKQWEPNGWQLFKRILIHEIEPRWQPLFS